MFIIVLTIALAVTIEAVTLDSVQEFKKINDSFQKVSQKHASYGKDVSLKEIIYNEDNTRELENQLLYTPNESLKKITHKNFLQDIYQRVNYVPLWFNYQGIKKEKLFNLFSTIKSDPTLEPNGKVNKQRKALEKAINTTKTRTLKHELSLELRLTDLARTYLGYHLYGALNWRAFQNKLSSLRRHKIAANWVTTKRKYDIAHLMLNFSFPRLVEMTTPKSFGYPKMIKALKRLRKAQKQGGWKKIPNSSQLRYGRSGNLVKRLTLHLQSEGDYHCVHKGKKYIYDKCVQQAVKRFQKRHGLYASGKINKYTIRKLNLSVNWKIKKVVLNLERIQKLPEQAEDRYVMVNIPDFRLYYKDNGREKLTMRVVVGDKKHHTPVFSNKISYIVLNPYWLIPDSIVQKEIIPKMIKNPKYLIERGYEVRKNYALSRPPLDSLKIDWAKILRYKQTKKYKFVQPPGKKNALGKIKFKFPNQFAVYLHDTPAKKYFKKGVRAFSHGCIRISQPNAFLKTFAPHEYSVNYRRAQRVLKGKKKTQLNLSQHVPVHIVYLTAWIKSDGLLHYRNDIYGYDSKQHRRAY